MTLPSDVNPSVFDLAAPPPQPKPIQTAAELHNIRREDPYSWLADKNDPDVLAHLAAENAYFAKLLAPTRRLSTSLYQEMRARVVESDTSVPTRNGAWFYAWTTSGTQEYRDLVRFGAADGAKGVGEPQMILNVNEMAKGKAYFRIAGFAPTRDGTKAAWLENTTGSLKSDLKIKSIAYDKEIPHSITDVASMFWGPDGIDLYIVIQDDAERAYRLDRYNLNAGTHDILLQEDDPEFSLDASLSADRSVIIATSHATDTTEVRLIDPANPTGQPKLVAARRDGHHYIADVADGMIFIQTDDHGLNGRIATAPVPTPDESHWQDLIPVRTEIALEGFNLFENFIVLSMRRDARTELEIFDRRNWDRHVISQTEAVYTIAATGNLEYKTDILRFSYLSFTSPGIVYDYDMDTRTTRELKRTIVPGGFDPEKYVSSRLYAQASDGTRIPISLIHRSDSKPDGDRPTLLYVYGAYGISMDPAFSNGVISLLDRGMVYAIAHVRGGGDQGRPWHEGGRLAAKINTFTDTNAAAEALIAAGWTKPQKLALEGRSAGGLTVGAAINLRPDLYGFAHLGVPFVDVINTMLDASIPLTTGEYREWGNPNEPEAFGHMHAYSPYDNLAVQSYPSLLLTTGINDMQVRYSEPVKYAAKLRALNNSARVAVRINMGVGHGGASGRYAALEERAEELALMLWILGIYQ
jgi:oligopeptidase B